MEAWGPYAGQQRYNQPGLDARGPPAHPAVLNDRYAPSLAYTGLPSENFVFQNSMQPPPYYQAAEPQPNQNILENSRTQPHVLVIRNDAIDGDKKSDGVVEQQSFVPSFKGPIKFKLINGSEEMYEVVITHNMTLSKCREELSSTIPGAFVFLRKTGGWNFSFVSRAKEDEGIVFNLLLKMRQGAPRKHFQYERVNYFTMETKPYEVVGIMGVVFLLHIPEGRSILDMIREVTEEDGQGNDGRKIQHSEPSTTGSTHNGMVDANDYSAVVINGVEREHTSTAEGRELVYFEFIPNITKMYDALHTKRQDDVIGVHEAAAYGDVESLRKILDAVNDDDHVRALRDTRESTPLHYASSNGKAESVREMLGKFSELDMVEHTDINEKTALHLSIEWKRFGAASIIVDRSGHTENAELTFRNTIHKLLQRVPLPSWEKYFLDVPVSSQTARHFAFLAVSDGNINVLTKMLKYIDDVNSNNNFLGRSLLHEAAENNREEIVKALIEEGATNEKEDKSGNSPLVVASRRGSVAMVSTLLSLEIKQDQYLKAVQFATQRKRASILVALFENQRAPFDKVTRTYLLSYLSAKCKSEELRMILQSCKDEIICQRFLGTIISDGDLDLFKTLVSNCVNVALADYMGRTALHEAAQLGRYEICEFLLGREDVNPDARDQRGSTPLHYACQTGQRDAAGLLLRNDAVQASSRDKVGRTPLLTALHHNHVKLARWMVSDHGDNIGVHLADNMGITPLHYAAHMAESDAVEFIESIWQHIGEENMSGEVQSLDAFQPTWTDFSLQDEIWGAHCSNALKSNRKNVDNPRFKSAFQLTSIQSAMSPLHAAVIANNRAMCRMLCRTPENLQIKDTAERTPLELAIDKRNRDVVECLLELYEASGTDIPQLSDYRKLRMENILKSEPDFMYDDIYEGPAVYRACVNGDIEAVKYILGTGVTANVFYSPGKRSRSWTPLLVAIRKRDEDVATAVLNQYLEKALVPVPDVEESICQLLLKSASKGLWRLSEQIMKSASYEDLSLAEKLTKDKHGCSIFHYAAKGGKLDVIEELLAVKDDHVIAAFDDTAVGGQTPLFYSVANGHLGIAKQLLLHGANPLKCKCNVEVYLLQFRQFFRDEGRSMNSEMANVNSIEFKPGRRQFYPNPGMQTTKDMEASLNHAMSQENNNNVTILTVRDTSGTHDGLFPNNLAKFRRNAEKLNIHEFYFGSFALKAELFEEESETQRGWSEVGEKHKDTPKLPVERIARRKKQQEKKCSKEYMQKPTLRTQEEKKATRQVLQLFGLALEGARKSATLLHIASAKGELEIMKDILFCRPDMINMPDGEGRTPLFYAALSGSVDTLQHLLEREAKVEQGPSPLIAALVSWASHTSTRLHEVLASLNTRHDFFGKQLSGYCSLYQEYVRRQPIVLSGCECDWSGIVQRLLSGEKTVASVEEAPALVAFMACTVQDSELFRKLQELSLNVNGMLQANEDSDDLTLSVVDLILEMAPRGNVAANNLTECIQTVLPGLRSHIVLHQVTARRIMKRQLWYLAELAIPKVQIVDAATWLPTFIKAAEQGVSPVVDKFIHSFGNDIGLATASRVLALHIACRCGHDQIVTMMLNVGVDIYSTIGDDMFQHVPGVYHRLRWTPFHWSCFRGHLGILQMLTQHAGSISNAKEGIQSNSNPNELPYIAACNGHIDVLKVLLEDWDIPLELCVNSGLNIKYAVTVLDIAALHNHHGIVRYVMEKMYQEYSTEISSLQQLFAHKSLSMYHVAGFFGWKDIVEMLMQHGCPGASKSDMQGLTPPVYALSQGYMDVYKLLCICEENEAGTLSDHSHLLSDVTMNVPSSEHVLFAFGWLHKHLSERHNTPLDIEYIQTCSLRDSMNTKGCFSTLLSALKCGAENVAKSIIQASPMVLASFIDNASDTDVRVSAMRFAVKSAATSGSSGCLEVILKNQSDENRNLLLNQNTGSSELLPLALAVLHDQIESFRTLLNYGARPDGVSNKHGQNLLHMAVIGSRDLNMVQEVRDRVGEDEIDSVDTMGLSPASWACALGRAQFLPYTLQNHIEQGIDVHTGDHSENIDYSCTHCLRNLSIGWFNKILRNEDVSDQSTVVPASPHVTSIGIKGRMSMASDVRKLYQWILAREDVRAARKVLQYIYLNSGDDLSDIGCNQDNLGTFLEVCYFGGTGNLPNRVLVALENVLRTSDVSTRADAINIVLDLKGSVDKQRVLHQAAILKLPVLVEELLNSHVASGDSVLKGMNVTETALAFGHTDWATETVSVWEHVDPTQAKGNLRETIQ
ncbi:uncharacterized protein [Ptychodera flava]